MAIRPGLLVRSQEDQPCVWRCSWTSPPLFLQCYGFAFLLIVACANAALRKSKTILPSAPHSSPLLSVTILLLDIHLVLIRLCGFASSQSVTIHSRLLSRSDRKAREFFHSVYFTEKKYTFKAFFKQIDSLEEFLTDRRSGTDQDRLSFHLLFYASTFARSPVFSERMT